jgi:hypothetical protein
MGLKRSKAGEVRAIGANVKASAPGVRISLGDKPLNFEWAATISQEEWATYRDAVCAVQAAGIPFMLGGGFALAAFTGRWRDTKDIDFYVHPHDRDAVVTALTEKGFSDFFNRLPYDRNWIYRSTRNNVIVDIIWSMANRRAQVDGIWFERARPVGLRDLELLVVPKEEFMWCKLYIMQRDHCDWTDLFNLVYASGRDLDWDHLLWRLGEDLPLLKGLLSVYSWLCPGEAAELPAELWERLELSAPPPGGESCRQDRIRFLDSRCWFAALRSPGEKLEV